MPTNWLTEEEFQAAINSFLSVFPHTSLWYVNAAHTCLIGPLNTHPVSFRALRERIEDNKAQQDLARCHLVNPFALANLFIADASALADYVGGAPSNTDNKPYIEFGRSTYLGAEPSILENLLWLRRPVSSILGKLGETKEEVVAWTLDEWYERAKAGVLRLVRSRLARRDLA